jgi:uncharacterized membrane protein YidH (DUF202 family)
MSIWDIFKFGWLTQLVNLVEDKSKQESLVFIIIGAFLLVISLSLVVVFKIPFTTTNNYDIATSAGIFVLFIVSILLFVYGFISLFNPQRILDEYYKDPNPEEIKKLKVILSIFVRSFEDKKGDYKVPNQQFINIAEALSRSLSNLESLGRYNEDVLELMKDVGRMQNDLYGGQISREEVISKMSKIEGKVIVLQRRINNI